MKKYSISINKVIAAFYLFIFCLQSSDGKTYIYKDKGFLHNNSRRKKIIHQ